MHLLNTASKTVWVKRLNERAGDTVGWITGRLKPLLIKRFLFDIDRAKVFLLSSPTLSFLLVYYFAF